VPVELRRLTQWKITAGGFADALAGLLGLPKPAQDGDAAGKRWKVGLLKSKEHKGEVRLAVENGVTVMVSGHTVPLSEVLTLNGGGLSIDQDELRRLVDKPGGQPGAQRYAPTNARRESRKLDTQKEYEGWRKAYRALKRKHPDKSDVWCSQQIARTDNPKGRDPETIRKHMRK
jgi:hypothetical protein